MSLRPCIFVYFLKFLHLSLEKRLKCAAVYGRAVLLLDLVAI
jgi:hypothetical protein